MSKKESFLPSVGSWGAPSIKRFREEIDSLFEELICGFGSNITMFDDLQSKSSFPKVNVSESESEYNVEVAVAGFSKEDITLKLENGVLTIQAEKKEESGEGSKNYLRREISSRSFSRAVKFPYKLNENEVSASYKDGLVNIVLPKVLEEEKPDGVTIDIE